MTTRTQDKKVIYRVYGDVCYAPKNDDISSLPSFKAEKYFDRYIIPELADVHVYDVYQDGSFHCFNPKTNSPMKEPDDFILDRKEIEKYIEENNQLGMGGVYGDNRASHEENEVAFQTLCKLGFGPQNRSNIGYNFWIVPGHEGTLRNTVRNFHVKYYGEDEPWISESEFCERYGVPQIIE